MSESKTEHDNQAEESITRKQLAELLNGDLSREFQAIIAYVVYSQSAERPPVHECC
jgi:bacterioferritin